MLGRDRDNDIGHLASQLAGDLLLGRHATVGRLVLDRQISSFAEASVRINRAGRHPLAEEVGEPR
jgi:hypothetical protein